MTYLISTDYNPNEKYYIATFGGDYDYQVTAKTHAELMSKIKKAVSMKKENGVRVTYGIFETDYEQDYIYCLNHSSVIQK